MIQRDGSCISLWQDSVMPYIASNAVKKGKLYDVIIVGGGITGISTALLLQSAGKDCLLLEAANLCFGTTGGTTAHLNTLLDTPYTTISKNFGEEDSKLVAKAVSEAIDLVRRNINLYNIDCGFADADAYLFAQDEKQEKELADIYEASQKAGLHLEYDNDIPVPIPFRKTIRVTGQAKFHPLIYVHALAAAFESLGGVIVQNCRVVSVEDNEIIRVEAEKGII